MVNEMKVNVGGMTCRSCASSIKEGLASVRGIRDVQVRFRERAVLIWYEDGETEPAAFEKRLLSIGFPVVGEKRALLERAAPLVLSMVLFALVTLISAGAPPRGTVGIDPDQAFLIGIASSIHCMAMCGGLMMSRVSRSVEGWTSANGRLRPVGHSLMYSIGRLVAYAVGGAFFGALGMSFAYSSAQKAVLLLIAAVALIVFGLKQMELFPRIEPHVRPAWYRGLRRRLRRGRRAFDRCTPVMRTFLLGLINGFMPCGALGAMWVIAAASGTAAAGAIIMAAFALGTVPAFAVLGALFTAIPQRWAKLLPALGAIFTTAFGFSLMRMAIMACSMAMM